MPPCTDWSDMWQLKHASTSLDTRQLARGPRSFYLYLIENCLIPLHRLPCGTTRQAHVAPQSLACSFTDSFERFICLRSATKEIHHEHREAHFEASCTTDSGWFGGRSCLRAHDIVARQCARQAIEERKMNKKRFSLLCLLLLVTLSHMAAVVSTGAVPGASRKRRRQMDALLQRSQRKHVRQVP